jgi:hypothetical protein
MYEFVLSPKATPLCFFFASQLFFNNQNYDFDMLMVSNVQLSVLQQHWWCEPCSWGRGLKFVAMASESVPALQN